MPPPTLALKLLPSHDRSLRAPLGVLMICLSLLPVAAVIKSYAESTSVVSSTPPLARLSDAVTIKTKSRGNPTVNLSGGHDILTAYVGPRELRAALANLKRQLESEARARPQVGQN